MTEIKNDKDHLDDYCEECGCEDESVSQNLLMFGYKICASCKISKTIFPIQVILLIGKLFNLLITKETDKIANIKNDKKTIPKALIFDLKFNISLVEIINEANIEN